MNPKDGTTVVPETLDSILQEYLKSGDIETLNKFCGAASGWVRKVLANFVRNRARCADDQEEYFQIAFVKMWELLLFSREKFSVVDDWQQFLTTCMINAIRTYLSKKYLALEKLISDEDLKKIEATSKVRVSKPVDTIDEEERVAAIQDILSGMKGVSEYLQEVVGLRYRNGDKHLTGAEIAEAVGLTETSIEVILVRMRKKLKDELIRQKILEERQIPKRRKLRAKKNIRYNSLYIYR